MRIVLSTLLAFSVTATAVAQTPPRITIEDDVAPATALQCAALRTTQTMGAPHDTLSAAALDAWLKSPGIDAAKVLTEAKKLEAATPAARTKMADDCATFEIRETH